MVETILPSNFVKRTSVSDICTVYTMTDIEGNGESTVYTLLPGITVSFNDFHTEKCNSDLHYQEKMIGIDHCQHGRIEWEHDDGSFCYLWEQDVQISSQTDHCHRYGFPTHHYHGVTINLFLEAAKESLAAFFPHFAVDLDQLWDKYCTQKDFFILRSEKKIHRIFEDMYEIREEGTTDLMRMKLIELLLLLSHMQPGEHAAAQKPYFKRSHVERVRLVHEYLCENSDSKMTLSELSRHFDIPLAIMKACFNSMYGQSIYAYAKNYRLHQAVRKLRQTDLSITQIAMDCGYENPSKFIAAFKVQFDTTPLQYRKHFNR